MNSSLFESEWICEIIQPVYHRDDVCLHYTVESIYMSKNISGGARQAKRFLDSAVSSLLALISREYTQLV